MANSARQARARSPETKASNRERAAARAGAGTEGGSDSELRARVAYWRDQGLTDGQVRHELQREGYPLDRIGKALRGELEPPEPDPTPTPATDDAASDAAPAKRPDPSSGGGGRVIFSGSSAGVLLAIVAYPAGIAFVTGGPSGLRRWFLAKFLNQTSKDAGVFSESRAINPTTGRAQTVTTAADGTPAPSAAIGASYTTPTTLHQITKHTKPRHGRGGGGSGVHTAPVVAVTKHPHGHSVTPGAGEGGSGAAQKAIGFAKSKLGTWYQWGGTGPRYDCSGLVMKAYESAGIHLGRTTRDQIHAGHAVSRSELRAGDLIFPTTHHVQIYLGGGKIIEAPHTGAKVRITPLGGVMTARRVA